MVSQKRQKDIQILREKIDNIYYTTIKNFCDNNITMK